MAGSVTFHQAGTLVANRFLPLVGDVSGSEAFATVPHTTTIVAEDGDIASIYSDAEAIIYRHPEGSAVPATGYRIPANAFERIIVRTGEVVTVAAP